MGWHLGILAAAADSGFDGLEVPSSPGLGSSFTMKLRRPLGHTATRPITYVLTLAK